MQEAWASIDGDTILLLLSLMILNSFLALAAFFRSLTRWAVGRATTPLALLSYLVLAAGVLSALFLNDTIAVMLSPLVLSLAKTLRRNPLPYLLALALAANVGSVATVTGNPQNLIVGLQSGIAYLDFSLALGPVALAGLGVVVAVVAVSFPGEFFGAPLQPATLPAVRVYRPLLVKAALVSGLMVAAFAIGFAITSVALAGAAALLLTRRVETDKVLAGVDWGLLVLFGGLFVVVGALEKTGLSTGLFLALRPLMEAGVPAMSLTVLVLANLVSNVPAVLLMAPVVPGLERPELAWLTVAMASTLAGNLTLVGSVANLIVAESARREGVTLSFGAYLRVGVPVTLLTLGIGVLWLSLYAGWHGL